MAKFNESVKSSSNNTTCRNENPNCKLSANRIKKKGLKNEEDSLSKQKIKNNNKNSNLDFTASYIPLYALPL